MKEKIKSEIQRLIKAYSPIQSAEGKYKVEAYEDLLTYINSLEEPDGRTYKFHIFNDDGRVIQRWGCSYVAEDYHNRTEYLSDPTLKYPTNVYSDKYDNPLDAVFEMVIWLKENNRL